MAYEPPCYDDASGQLRPPAPPPFNPLAAAAARLRQGVSRPGTGEEYASLTADDAENAAEASATRANNIALQRQQQNAATFQRQIEADEEFFRSSSRQMASDAEMAAKLSEDAGAGAARAPQDPSHNTDNDAAIAAALQRREEMESAVYDAPAYSAPEAVSRARKEKVVRVKVPSRAKPGDMLVVSTPTTGKFEVAVPGFAPPDSYFDCVVTTI
ncbi:hypothetical protein M885DRAFT_22696 [Pelagophyceae sp. CCMP2097]|nr:hypothetical protein M885DRAFT_22696 [Pelagophyceae sp. CCMP2097]